MTENSINFELQKLIVSNKNWNVELCYESYGEQEKKLDDTNCESRIELNAPNEWTSKLGLTITDKIKNKKECIVTGIDGSVYLHELTEKDNSQSVKIINDNIILSLGFTLLSLNLNSLEINWAIRPDTAEIFEFYDLEKDYLLRGELAIHRIDSDGNIKWSYGGKDIWVNIDGKQEICIEPNVIKLIDFEGNEYVIDYFGRTIEHKPVNSNTKKKKWWNLWR